MEPTTLHERVAAADPIVDAQHDETGRMWRGPLSQLPRRYAVVIGMAPMPGSETPGLERETGPTPPPPGSYFALARLRFTSDNPPPWRPWHPDFVAGAETFRLQAMAAVARGGDPYAVIRDLALRAPVMPPLPDGQGGSR